MRIHYDLAGSAAAVLALKIVSSAPEFGMPNPARPWVIVSAWKARL